MSLHRRNDPGLFAAIARVAAPQSLGPIQNAAAVVRRVVHPRVVHPLRVRLHARRAPESTVRGEGHPEAHISAGLTPARSLMTCLLARLTFQSRQITRHAQRRGAHAPLAPVGGCARFVAARSAPQRSAARDPAPDSSRSAHNGPGRHPRRSARDANFSQICNMACALQYTSGKSCGISPAG
jgi:hypothetical protein